MSLRTQEYFLSSSFSGSYYVDDIADVSFRVKRSGHPVDGLSYVQYVDLYGFFNCIYNYRLRTCLSRHYIQSFSKTNKQKINGRT